MTRLNRRLLRIAGRLQAAYGAIRKQRQEPDLPTESWLDAQRILRRWTLARNRGWSAAAADEQRSLCAELEYLGNRLRDKARELRIEEYREIPTLRTLYDELVATEAEFGELVVEETELTVTTESIVLEGIDLGPFQIRLDIDRLGGGEHYSIVALEPNPAASCSETTHPHVSGEQLCAGEGQAAISAAIKQGRMFDFFTIVDRILNTYSADSPYVELSRWYGISCQDCDCCCDEDDACSCFNCEKTLCGDCQVYCDGCSCGYCSACTDRCACCDESYCGNCLTRCSCCHREVCKSCRDEAICIICQEERQNESEEQLESTPAGISNVPTESAV